MPDFKQVMTDEIRRLARKEIKLAVSPLQESISALKKQLSEAKKTISDLTKKLDKVAPAVEAPAAVVVADEKAPQGRINAQGIKKMRDKKKITQGQLAALLGVTLHTVSMWEIGRNIPRKEMKNKICAVRDLGKRELAEKLALVAGKAAEAPKAPAAGK